MKKKHFFSLVLLMSLSLCMVSCSNGNNDEPEINEPENNEPGAAVGPVAVDLGLSVKWASCNVGATLPEEYGGYFSWGETEEKDFYGWSAYKLCNGTINTLTKYCYDEMEGNVDNKMVLEPIDDVANVVMGEGWRMPTDAEIMELVEGCTWEWTVLNDVNGYRVTGTNGNSIFLPAAGYISGKEVEYPGVYGMYWSSTIGDLFTYHGCCLEFTSQYFVNMVTYRNGGQTVRAVFE